MCASDANAADVAAQVAAVLRVQAVGLDHHCHGVPAHVGAQAAFELEVAGALGLVGRLDRVDVGRVRGEGAVHAVLARFLKQSGRAGSARDRLPSASITAARASSHSRVS